MLEDNVVFLKKNYPELYEKINEIDVKNFNDNFIIEQTRNNQETIKVKKGESYIYLHSKYDPMREAETVIRKFEEKETIDENSHVIFYGAGLGYHIELFARKYPDTYFSIYEPSAGVFRHFLDKLNLKKLPVYNLKNIQCEFGPETLDAFLAKLLNKTNKKLIMNRYRIINTNNKESTGLLIDFVALHSKEIPHYGINIRKSKLSK